MKKSFWKGSTLGRIIIFALIVCLSCSFISVFAAILSPSKKTPTPTPTLDILKAIGSTQTAAAILFPPNTFTAIPTDTAITIPTDNPTEIPTLIPFVPSDTPIVILPTATLITIAPTQPPAAGPCSCSGDTLNCTDFSGHAAAQACYDYCKSIGRGDIHRLDRDGDGNACES